jgi:hypothetical protein
MYATCSLVALVMQCSDMRCIVQIRYVVEGGGPERLLTLMTMN